MIKGPGVLSLPHLSLTPDGLLMQTDVYSHTSHRAEHTCVTHNDFQVGLRLKTSNESMRNDTNPVRVPLLFVKKTREGWIE